MPKKQVGFTVLELIVTMTIAAILLSVGIPSFINTILTNRLAGATNEMVSMLMYARAEGVKRNSPVIICRSSNGASCNNPAGGWEAGWIVFIDGNCSGTYDPAGAHPDTSGSCPGSAQPDQIVNVHSAISGGLSITGSSSVANDIRFSSIGINLEPMGTLTVKSASDTTNSNIRLLCIGVSGRSHLMPKGTSTCPN